MNERTYNIVSDAVDTSIQRLCAIMSLLEPLQEECFEPTCAGLLGSVEGSQEQKEKAYAWMKQNYDRVNAAVFAATLLVTDSMNDLEAVSIKLYKARKNALERVKGGPHGK